MADIRRLRELVDSDERINAWDYIDLVRRVGRIQPERVIELGNRTYSLGLKQAILDGDLDGPAEVATAGAQILDAAGLQWQAIARLDQAAPMAAGDPTAQGAIHACRVMSLGFSGRVDLVRRSLEEDDWATRGGSEEDIASSIALARCLILDFAKTEAIQASIEGARSIGQDRHATSVMVQVIAALAARGEVDESRAAASDLLECSTKIGHRARQIDAEVALSGLLARGERSRSKPGLGDEAQRLFNNHAMWKLFVAHYRQRVLSRERSETAETYADILSHYDWVNPGYRNSFAGLDRYRAALADPPEDVELPVPDLPTLLSLPNILASAEAVAVGGR